MAHFAKIENNKVVDVIVIANEDCGGGKFPDSEKFGQDFISVLAQGDKRLKGTWLQTSYNNNFRGVFGQIGFLYNPDEDIFVSTQDESVITLEELDSIADAS